jgi:ribose/xylose/arabinose/galactoside ABC-type transport system permease subunit
VISAEDKGFARSLGAARPRALQQHATAMLACAGLVFLIACAWFLLATDGFASWANMKAILAASSFIGIVAIGQTAVMLSGNFFSMSLGIQAAGSAIFFLWALKFGLVPAIALTIALSALVAAVQGYAVGAWGASPIIITIASGVLITGFVVLITGGTTVHPPPDGPSIAFLGDRVGGIAVSALVMIGVAILAQLALKRTRFGAMTYLVGASRPAARAAALPVTLTIVVAFGVAGACAAVAGVMMSGFQQTASLSLQGTLTFDAIAAVLVGGCSVLGGRGSALATLVGTLGITAINSALILRGYSNGVQILVKGTIVLGAVVGVYVWNRERR